MYESMVADETSIKKDVRTSFKELRNSVEIEKIMNAANVFSSHNKLERTKPIELPHKAN